MKEPSEFDLRRPPKNMLLKEWDHQTPAWVLYCTIRNRIEYMHLAYDEIGVVSMCEDHIRRHGPHHAEHMHVAALTEELHAATMAWLYRPNHERVVPPAASSEISATFKKLVAESLNIYRGAPTS